jgi:hypothetical protein
MPNIQLPPIQPDDFFKKLSAARKQPVNKTNDTDKIEELLENEQERVQTLDSHIEKVYKTTTFITDSQKTNNKKIKSIIEKLTEETNKKNKDLEKHISSLKTDVSVYKKAASKVFKALTDSMNKYVVEFSSAKNEDKLYYLVKPLFSNVGKASTWITDKMGSAYDFSKRFLSIGLEFASNAIHCVSKFLFGPFKLAWGIVDSLLTKLTGPIWRAIKGVVSSATKVVKWFVKTGIDAILYVWKGFSTIFKVGFTIVSKAVQYLAYGTKAFFGWWFKLLSNTIFSPSMWIVNIPLFLVLCFAIVSAITLLLTAGVASLVLVEGAFAGAMNVVESVGSWIWSGVSGMFGWLKNEYESSTWLKPTIDKAYKSISDSIESWWGTHEHVRAAFSWINTSYNWIKTNLTPIVSWVEDEYNKVISFFSSVSKKTLVEKYVDILNHIPGTGFVISYLTSKFGFAFASGINDQLRKKIQDEKVLGFQETLQNALISIPKNLNEKDFNALVNKNIDTLQTGAFGGLSTDAVENIKNQVIANIKKGEGGFSDENILARVKYVDELEAKLKLTRSGLLDANNAKDKEFIEKLLKSGILLDKQAMPTSNIPTPAQFDELIENEKKIQLQDATLRNIATNIEAQDAESIKRSQSIVSRTLDAWSLDIGTLWDFSKPYARDTGIIAGVLADKTSTALSYYKGKADALDATVYNKLSSTGVGRLLYGSASAPGTSSSITNNQSNIPFPALAAPSPGPQSPSTETADIDISLSEHHFAMGGIVPPAAKNILPLDSIGRDYIRSKIKDIRLPDDEIKKQKDITNNITIIEESSNNMESHELYTMRQLSKGLLGNK